VARHGIALTRATATARLLLVCHASTPAVRAAAFPADEPLDEQGRRRAAALSRHVDPGARCLTSPALRARQTAEALRLEATVEPMVRDCDYGRWRGRSLEELQAEEPAAIAQWLKDADAAPHGGESLRQVLDRVATWLEAESRQPRKTIVVTHAAVIRAAILHAIGAPPPSFWRIDVAPLSRTTLTVREGRWTLRSIFPPSAA